MDASFADCLLPKLQVAVEAPDLVSDLVQLARLFGCFRHQLLQQPLCMNPTQGMIGDAELSGIVGHDPCVAHQSLVTHLAPEGNLGNLAHQGAVEAIAQRKIP